MTLQDKTLAALDTSAHLTGVENVTLPRFLAALLKDAEAIETELVFMSETLSGSAFSGKVDGGGTPAVSTVTQGILDARNLSDWARAMREASRGIALELANLTVAGVADHAHPGDLIVRSASGSGTISGQTYFNSGSTEPANAQLTAFTSDNDSITLTVEIHARGADWQPSLISIELNGTSVGVAPAFYTQLGSGRVFEVDLALGNASESGTITITDSDGVETTVSYTRGDDPVGAHTNTLPVNWVQ